MANDDDKGVTLWDFAKFGFAAGFFGLVLLAIAEKRATRGKPRQIAPL